MNNQIPPLEWKNSKLFLLDQRKLPHEEIIHEIKNVEEAYLAIKDMIVRGAPLIGFTGIYGLLVYMYSESNITKDGFLKAASYLKTARPTAVNLVFEIEIVEKMLLSHLETNKEISLFRDILENHCSEQMKLLFEKNLKMAKLASEELKELYGDRPLNLMTLCNTGYLACGPMGTALGVISYMNDIGRVNHVYASETRPYLQGGRLTAYELSKHKINHSLVVEGSFSHLLKNKMVDAVFIGADRIVSNGDTANKVGSSTLSIVCKHYGIPFYVVAPLSSFDFDLKTGDEIEIELRPEDEVLTAMGTRIAPLESRAFNPSFDVTDHDFITAIFCENGKVKPVNEDTMKGIQ